MEKKKIIPDWLSIVLVILVFLSIVRSILFVPQNVNQGQSVAFIIIKILECVTYLFALAYCFSGYKKDSAKMFKAFSLTYTLFAFAALYGKFIYIKTNNVSIATIIIACIVWILLLVITVSKNLGWHKSYQLACGVFVCELISIFLAINMDISYILTLVGRAVIALIFCIMVYAKYQDKKQRGTV